MRPTCSHEIRLETGGKLYTLTPRLANLHPNLAFIVILGRVLYYMYQSPSALAATHKQNPIESINKAALIKLYCHAL